jgi:hypothetical protein
MLVGTRERGKEDYYNYCLDFALFDNSISHCDLYKVQTLAARRTEITDSLLKMQQYDYPFCKRNGTNKEVIQQRATRLMTGHYLTSIVGTGMQISSYNEMKRMGYKFDVRGIIGDDAVLSLPISEIQRVVEYFESRGSTISRDKSYTFKDLACYNRRV